MKFDVFIGDIEFGLHPAGIIGDQLVQPVEIGICPARAGEANRMGLKYDPGLAHVAHGALVKRQIQIGLDDQGIEPAVFERVAQENAGLRPALRQPQRIKHRQRFAHRAAGDAKAIRQLALRGQPVALLQSVMANELDGPLDRSRSFVGLQGRRHLILPIW